MATPQPEASEQTNYSCDTLPTPRHIHRPPGTALSRSPSPVPQLLDEDTVASSFAIVTPEEVHSSETEHHVDTAGSSPTQTSERGPERSRSDAPPQPSARKLCVRHQRMADEGTNLKIQKVSQPHLDYHHGDIYMHTLPSFFQNLHDYIHKPLDSCVHIC